MLKDRLKEAREKAGITQQQLADSAGIAQSTIMFLESGRNKGSTRIVDIAKALGVSPDWLLYGKDQPNATIIQKGVNSWGKDTEKPDDIVAVPFYKELSLSAGYGAFNGECPNNSMKLWFAKTFLKRMNTSEEYVFCVTVHGDSMEPRYDEGGVVMVDTTPQNIIDGKAYAITDGDGDYIKYLRRLPDNRVLISSENPIYKSYERSLEDITIIGRRVCYQREE
ncbi:MAG: XRE family transcriptional regulator [Wohlfahrtiimonas sp.]